MRKVPRIVERFEDALSALGKPGFADAVRMVDRLQLTERLWVNEEAMEDLESPHRLFDACACGACAVCLMSAGVLQFP